MADVLPFRPGDVGFADLLLFRRVHLGVGSEGRDELEKLDLVPVTLTKPPLNLEEFFLSRYFCYYEDQNITTGFSFTVSHAEEINWSQKEEKKKNRQTRTLKRSDRRVHLLWIRACLRG